MNLNPLRPNWLDSLAEANRACFFYTTEEEFFSIALPYLKECLENSRERFLWILPPQLVFSKAREELDKKIGSALDQHLRRRRFLIVPWDKWYGTERSIQDLLKKSDQILQEALHDGFEGLRILSHSPDRTSSYWKDFFSYEEASSRRFKNKPVISLCAYSLIDCPAQAISSIALNHSICMIHRGSEWEWLVNKQPSTLSL